MTTILSLPSLSKLTFHSDKDGVDLWIRVSEWTNFLHENLVPGDTCKVKGTGSHVLRDLRTGGETLKFQGVIWTSFSALLHFAFRRKYAMKICRTITEETEACLLNKIRAVPNDSVIVQHDNTNNKPYTFVLSSGGNDFDNDEFKAVPNDACVDTFTGIEQFSYSPEVPSPDVVIEHAEENSVLDNRRNYTANTSSDIYLKRSTDMITEQQGVPHECREEYSGINGNNCIGNDENSSNLDDSGQTNDTQGGSMSCDLKSTVPSHQTCQQRIIDIDLTIPEEHSMQSFQGIKYSSDNNDAVLKTGFLVDNIKASEKSHDTEASDHPDDRTASTYAQNCCEDSSCSVCNLKLHISASPDLTEENDNIPQVSLDKSDDRPTNIKAMGKLPPIVSSPDSTSCEHLLNKQHNPYIEINIPHVRNEQKSTITAAHTYNPSVFVSETVSFPENDSSVPDNSCKTTSKTSNVKGNAPILHCVQHGNVVRYKKEIDNAIQALADKMLVNHSKQQFEKTQNKPLFGIGDSDTETSNRRLRDNRMSPRYLNPYVNLCTKSVKGITTGKTLLPEDLILCHHRGLVVSRNTTEIKETEELFALNVNIDEHSKSQCETNAVQPDTKRSLCAYSTVQSFGLKTKQMKTKGLKPTLNDDCILISDDNITSERKDTDNNTYPICGDKSISYKHDESVNPYKKTCDSLLGKDIESVQRNAESKGMPNILTGTKNSNSPCVLSSLQMNNIVEHSENNVAIHKDSVSSTTDSRGILERLDTMVSSPCSSATSTCKIGQANARSYTAASMSKQIITPNIRHDMLEKFDKTVTNILYTCLTKNKDSRHIETINAKTDSICEKKQAGNSDKSHVSLNSYPVSHSSYTENTGHLFANGLPSKRPGEKRKKVKTNKKTKCGSSNEKNRDKAPIKYVTKTKQLANRECPRKSDILTENLTIFNCEISNAKIATKDSTPTVSIFNIPVTGKMNNNSSCPNTKHSNQTIDNSRVNGCGKKQSVGNADIGSLKVFNSDLEAIQDLYSANQSKTSVQTSVTSETNLMYSRALGPYLEVDQTSQQIMNVPTKLLVSGNICSGPQTAMPRWHQLPLSTVSRVPLRPSPSTSRHHNARSSVDVSSLRGPPHYPNASRSVVDQNSDTTNYIGTPLIPDAARSRCETSNMITSRNTCTIPFLGSTRLQDVRACQNVTHYPGVSLSRDESRCTSVLPMQVVSGISDVLLDKSITRGYPDILPHRVTEGVSQHPDFQPNQGITRFSDASPNTGTSLDICVRSNRGVPPHLNARSLNPSNPMLSPLYKDMQHCPDLRLYRNQSRQPGVRHPEAIPRRPYDHPYSTTTSRLPGVTTSLYTHGPYQPRSFPCPDLSAIRGMFHTSERMTEGQRRLSNNSSLEMLRPRRNPRGLHDIHHNTGLTPPSYARGQLNEAYTAIQAAFMLNHGGSTPSMQQSPLQTQDKVDPTNTTGKVTMSRVSCTFFGRCVSSPE